MFYLYNLKGINFRVLHFKFKRDFPIAKIRKAYALKAHLALGAVTEKLTGARRISVCVLHRYIDTSFCRG